MMNRFGRALRLAIALDDLIDAGKGDSPEADTVRDNLDPFVGWCGPQCRPEDRLSEEERQLLVQVLAACREGE